MNLQEPENIINVGIRQRKTLNEFEFLQKPSTSAYSGDDDDDDDPSVLEETLDKLKEVLPQSSDNMGSTIDSILSTFPEKFVLLFI